MTVMVNIVKMCWESHKDRTTMLIVTAVIVLKLSNSVSVTSSQRWRRLPVCTRLTETAHDSSSGEAIHEREARKKRWPHR
jgi:hypothetical protein